MSYQGHESYEHWNVALWLYNDEGLYNMVQEVVAVTSSQHDAANVLHSELTELLPNTPDGVEFTLERIEAAIAEEYA